MKKGRSNHKSSANKDFGLPKADILRGRTNFKRLFDGSATVYPENHINLRFHIFTGQADTCKMGFIVAKRLGKATRRNRVRRLLKEAYRLNRHSFMGTIKSSSASFHGALMAKSIDFDFNTARQEVISLLNRVVVELHSSFDL